MRERTAQDTSRQLGHIKVRHKEQGPVSFIDAIVPTLAKTIINIIDTGRTASPPEKLAQ